MSFFLLQAAEPAWQPERILWPLAGLVVGVLLIVVIALILRATLLSKQRQDPKSAGFTLADMRRLHQQGQLSDEEFEAIRQKMIRRGRGEEASDGPEPPHTAGPPEGPGEKRG